MPVQYVSEYGCTRCQVTHTDAHPLYGAHLMYQSKHGVRTYGVECLEFGIVLDFKGGNAVSFPALRCPDALTLFGRLMELCDEYRFGMVSVSVQCPGRGWRSAINAWLIEELDPDALEQACVEAFNRRKQRGALYGSADAAALEAKGA